MCSESIHSVTTGDIVHCLVNNSRIRSVQSSLHPTTLNFRSILILSSHMGTCFPSGISPQFFPTGFCMHLSSPPYHATRPTHLFLLDMRNFDDSKKAVARNWSVFVPYAPPLPPHKINRGQSFPADYQTVIINLSPKILTLSNLTRFIKSR